MKLFFLFFSAICLSGCLSPPKLSSFSSNSILLDNDAPIPKHLLNVKEDNIEYTNIGGIEDRDFVLVETTDSMSNTN